MHDCLKQEDVSYSFLLRVEGEKLMLRVWTGRANIAHTQFLDIGMKKKTKHR